MVIKKEEILTSHTMKKNTLFGGLGQITDKITIRFWSMNAYLGE